LQNLQRLVIRLNKCIRLCKLYMYCIAKLTIIHTCTLIGYKWCHTSTASFWLFYAEVSINQSSEDQCHWFISLFPQIGILSLILFAVLLLSSLLAMLSKSSSVWSLYQDLIFSTKSSVQFFSSSPDVAIQSQKMD